MRERASSQENPDSSARPKTGQAILMMVGASATIALLWALIRTASDTMHPFYILFWRSLFGLLILSPLFMRIGLSGLRTKRLPLHFLRSMMGILAMVGIFYSIAHIPLAQAMAINYSAPLFATLGAVLLLGEPVRMRRMVAVLIGFSGMLIVLRPGMQEIELGTLAAILGAMGMAASLLCIKRLSATENNSTIIVYGNTIGLPIALVLALGFWKWPSWEELGLLLAIGAFSTTAQLFLNRALALAEASAVLPVDFLRLVFVSLLGALLFAEPVNAFTWIGGAVILFSTVYIGHRESQAAKARGQKAVTPPSETP